MKRPTIPRWVLIIAFALAAVVTMNFGVRAVVSAIYWSQHRDEPIQPWMTDLGLIVSLLTVLVFGIAHWRSLAFAQRLEPAR